MKRMTRAPRCLGFRVEWREVGVCVAVLLACGVQAAWAGDGVVALQTADPSCGDDSDSIYVNCGNGTVTDNRTGLVWLQNANCLSGAPGGGRVDWHAAMEFVAGLSDKPAISAAATHDCGLSDGSSPGEWRLPSVEEWEAMVADAKAMGCVFGVFGGPSITNDAGTSCWGPASSFTGVVSSGYWSSTSNATSAAATAFAWFVALNSGNFFKFAKPNSRYVWPVRGGQ